MTTSHPAAGAATSRRQRGFTLIEVLVAVLILAVGLLGLAGLQLVGVKNSQGAYLRTQAAAMAADILDRMRANLPATRNGDYDIDFGDDGGVFVPCIGAAADCTSAQFADFDLGFWKAMLAGQLALGDASVATAAAGTATRVTVTVRWIDPYNATDAGGNPNPEQLVVTADL